MSYAPVIPFQPVGLAPGIGMFSGALQDWEKKREDQQRKLASADAIVQHARQKGLLSEEEFNKYQAGGLNQKIGTAFGFAENFAQDLAERHFQAGQDYHAAQLAQDATKMNMAAAQNAFERDLATKRLAQDLDIAKLHYGPGGRDAPFTPDEPTRQTMKEHGYIFAPTSNKAGEWHNLGGDKPDLDENGNPKFTPDGSAYITGGKVKPVTPEMKDARDAYNEQQKAKADAAANGSNAVESASWFSNWLGGGKKTKPAAAPPAASPQQYPKGTRARKGDKWFVMTDQGWQPE